MDIRLNLIVAYCDKQGIGKDNKIPWNISNEMLYFKKITTYTNNPILKNVVIMGRKTWESIPQRFRPLSDRINIVLTKNKNFEVNDGVFIADSLESSFDIIHKIQNSNKKNVFIIGGETLYREGIINKYCHKLYISEIYNKYECDRYFPDIPDKFKIMTVSNFCYESSVHYRKIVYVNSELDNTELWKNKEEQQYLDCLVRITKLGNINVDRTGVGTYSTFGETFRYDLSDTFPLLTTKKMWLRAIFEELKFYLSGKTDNSILTEKGINIWNENTTRDFLDKRGLSHYPEHDMGESYGFNFRHYGSEYKTCKEDYTGKGFDQVNYVINLIRNNPTSRRIIIDLWNGSTLDKASLPPCLCKYQFYVNTTDNKLDLMIYLRSSDFFLANNWNVCTGAFLVYMICNLEGIKYTPGILTVITGDTHIYKSHIKQVEENIERVPRPYPKLIVKEKKKDIMNFEFSDFKLIGYNPYPNIKADMAV